jgi:beta-1,2-mannobiose phosphorylase / 1,2-beta-oligomannan phosphorylase
MFVVHRSKHNPILGPDSNHSFESFSTFNGNPICVGNKIYILYRAQSYPEKIDGNHFSLSSICKAVSGDGTHFKNREIFISPEKSWERYGCEDPRVTKLGNKYYIFYTALSTYPFSAQGIRVGLAISKDMKTIEEKHLVTPFNAKAMVLFPEKIKGKYVSILTANTDLPPSHIGIAEFEKIEDIWSEKYWKKWYDNLNKNTLEIPKFEGEHLEVGSCPIKTKDGWLIIYSVVQKYFSNDKIFGIEAVLLDLKNPRKIMGKTRGALLVPTEQYEKFGTVPNTIFPSGACVIKNNLHVYYGATDTTTSLATVDLGSLLESMKFPWKEIGFRRLTEGELLKPRKNIPWESKAIFNPGAVEIDDKINILYRAMSQDNTSVIGLAQSRNGTDISYLSDKPIYTPNESFESKSVPGGNSGCEDPRITRIGNKIYMCYTAYNGITPPSAAITSISVSDFKKKKWNWSKPVLVTADGVDDKDACLHPEKVKGKYFLYHRVNNYICGDYGETTQFKERNNFRNIPILLPRKGMWDSQKVGLSVPPIKTKKGWILIYHGVSGRSRYRIGAVLLDLNDPTIVLSRTTDAIFEPREAYEIEGQVNYVVFPCGAVVRKGIIYMYYGGADSVVDVASMKLKDLLDVLTK